MPSEIWAMIFAFAVVFVVVPLILKPSLACSRSGGVPVINVVAGVSCAAPLML